ncbi:MAG: phosphoribosylamine--glycine ligase, partial [Thermoplasmata archaeon]
MDTKVLLVGSGGREDAIARSIVNSNGILYSVMAHKNPSISRMSREFLICSEIDYKRIIDYCISTNIDIVFVGPDPVLETPLVDELLKRGITVASPTREAARIETSKAFMRDLLSKYNVNGNIEYHKFYSRDDVEKFMNSFGGDVAVKPIGLTGGKGVKVMGEQLKDRGEAIQYADHLIQSDGMVLIEEKIEGEEFSLQAFTDGKDLAFMPIVQDYKKAYEGDKGPNTGGMGSISDKNFSLPFLSSKAKDSAESTM